MTQTEYGSGISSEEMTLGMSPGWCRGASTYKWERADGNAFQVDKPGNAWESRV